MGINPLRPNPQLIRAFSLLPAPGSTFDVPQRVNVANAFEVELLVRYRRSNVAPGNNALAMKINYVNEHLDGKSYARSIEDGTLTTDATLQGFDSNVAATIKLFTFPGLPVGGEGLVTYIVRVGAATAMEFTFAEVNQGVIPSELNVYAALQIQSGSP